jgi:hypothetical protein
MYLILNVKVKVFMCLTLNLLTTTIVAPPSNASKWQMGFNSAFKGLNNDFVMNAYGGDGSTASRIFNSGSRWR